MASLRLGAVGTQRYGVAGHSVDAPLPAKGWDRYESGTLLIGFVYIGFVFIAIIYCHLRATNWRRNGAGDR